jgi:hypothetical protein
MKLLCKLFGHQWKAIEPDPGKFGAWQCRRCEFKDPGKSTKEVELRGADGWVRRIILSENTKWIQVPVLQESGGFGVVIYRPKVDRAEDGVEIWTPGAQPGNFLP